MASELRQLVQKKYAVARQTDLSVARPRWLNGTGSRESPEDIISPSLVPLYQYNGDLDRTRIDGILPVQS